MDEISTANNAVTNAFFIIVCIFPPFTQNLNSNARARIESRLILASLPVEGAVPAWEKR
jgi:hypothetical protein